MEVILHGQVFIFFTYIWMLFFSLSISKCVCIWMCMCMCTCMHACVYVHTHVWICWHIFMPVCGAHAYKWFMCMGLGVYVLCVQIVSMFLCIDMYMHVHIQECFCYFTVFSNFSKLSGVLKVLTLFLVSFMKYSF